MKWCINGNNYSQFDSGTTVNDELPVGVYQLNYDDKHNVFYLVKISEKFDFNYKIYGLERDFIDRVLKTYNYTTGNLGVLLYGIKGTGKTVTAKIIATCLENPCIIVNEYNPGLAEFLSSIDVDCTVFFDEFEKGFGKNCDDGIAELLSLMDGVYTNGGRKVYLLTCNNLNIEDNFLGRPSRIRYSKEFGNLSLDVVTEYLNDNLINKEIVNNVIGLLNRLSIVTIDTIKCLVEEINIHGYVDDILNDFNVEKQKFVYKMEYRDSDEISSLDDFKKQLTDLKGKPNSKRYDNMSYRYVTLNKPIDMLVINDNFHLNFTTVSIIKPITEDRILICKDSDNTIYYIHVAEGGKMVPFFPNAY